jgi:hypothetical protein
MGNTGYDFPQANFHVSLESHMSIPGVNISQLPGRQVDLILYGSTYYFQHNYCFFYFKIVYRFSCNVKNPAISVV